MSTCCAGCGSRATRRRIAPCAVSGTISETAAPRAAASRAISETKSGLPLVRPATAAASSGRRAARRSPRSGPRRRPRRGRRAATTPPPRRSRRRAGRGRSRRAPRGRASRRRPAPGGSARLGSRNRSRCRLPASAQCRSSSSSTTGNSVVRPSSTAEHAVEEREPVRRLRSLSRSRRRRPARPLGGRAARRARRAPAGRRSPAWRRTWVQSQNAGAPVAVVGGGAAEHRGPGPTGAVADLGQHRGLADARPRRAPRAGRRLPPTVEQRRDQHVGAVEDGGSPQQHATQASDRRPAAAMSW